MRWPDGSYSIQGAAEALGITTQTVFKWLRRGGLNCQQRRVGQPCKIQLTFETTKPLMSQVRRINGYKSEAS
jgi:predicted site-specific integrase-resolvase